MRKWRTSFCQVAGGCLTTEEKSITVAAKPGSRAVKVQPVGGLKRMTE